MPILSKVLMAIAGIAGAAFMVSGGYSAILKNPDITVKKEIFPGATFGLLASEAGIATSTREAVLSGAKGVYDLASITAGKELSFVYDQASGALKKLIYEIDRETQLVIQNKATGTSEFWEASKIPIEYETRIDQAKGVIENSLYETILEQGLDERLALALAEMFAWQIDFAGEIQKGDSFKVIYEKKLRDGKYDHPGDILAAEFITSGEKFQGFYFPGTESQVRLGDSAGYFDENGNSLEKVFLKAPLQYKYISSGYTNRRFNPILNQYTKHRGIDYAAPSGTPAVSVGDGTVVQAGWNGQYGISVKVRHNDVYTTVYGHFMSLAKGIRVGTKVRQGQIVGYVGSTGLSTGPHLHYEMHKFGSFINPFTEKVPSIEPVKEGDRAVFSELKRKYQEELLKI